MVKRDFSCKRGEIALIVNELGAIPATGVCRIEVRQRSSSRYGDGTASVNHNKQAKLIIAVQIFLQRYNQPPACLFDVLAIDDDRIEWIKNAFET